MPSYNTSDFRKGLKVQIDGEPYLMIEMNFVKPGKGNAFYKCKLKNLIRGNIDTFVFMENNTYEQYELSAEQVDDAWKYLKEEMQCQVMLFNGNPVIITPPNQVELKVEYCEPAAKGNTATNVTKPVKVETGAEFQCPAFIEIGNVVKIDTRSGDYVERVRT